MNALITAFKIVALTWVVIWLFTPIWAAALDLAWPR